MAGREQSHNEEDHSIGSVKIPTISLSAARAMRKPFKKAEGGWKRLTGSTFQREDGRWMGGRLFSEKDGRVMGMFGWWRRNENSDSFEDSMKSY